MYASRRTEVRGQTAEATFLPSASGTLVPLHSEADGVAGEGVAMHRHGSRIAAPASGSYAYAQPCDHLRCRNLGLRYLRAYKGKC